MIWYVKKAENRNNGISTLERLTVYSFSSKRAVHACQVALVVSDFVWSCGLELARLLCSWDSPGKNTGVGGHALLQGIFLTQGSNPHLLHLPVLAGEFFTASATWKGHRSCRKSITGPDSEGQVISTVFLPSVWCCFSGLFLFQSLNVNMTLTFCPESGLHRLWICCPIFSP